MIEGSAGSGLTEKAPGADAPANNPPAALSLEAKIHVQAPGPWIQLISAKGFEWGFADLPIPGLPAELEGFRILHLSDLHARPRWDPAYDDVIAQTQANPPDVILYTGDYVDDRYDHRDSVATVKRFISALKSRLGSFGILGNHDGDLFAPPLSSLDLTLVDHRRLILTSGSASLELIGLAGVDRRDIDIPFLQSLGPKLPGTVRIALCHYPDSIRRVTFLEPDLFLAGHTHGGQICFPGGTPLLRHDSLPRYLCSGINRVYDTWMVVNRGLGFSSIPIRLFCPAEVIEIRLKKA